MDATREKVDATARRRLLSGIDLLILAAVAFAIVYVAFAAASREHVPSGKLIVFVAFFALLCVGFLVTRFHIIGGALCLAAVVTVDQIDQVKFAATRSRLHPADLFIGFNFLKDMDYALAVQYAVELKGLYVGLGIVLIALPAIWYYERRANRDFRIWRLPRGAVLVPAVAAVAFFAVLLSSQYLRALASFHPADLQWSHGGIRLSSLVLEANQLREMDREIKDVVAEAQRTGFVQTDSHVATTCETIKCADILVVHLESIFDPVLLPEYRAEGGYLDHMDQASSVPSQGSGLLRVHAYGGASWFSEFAVLCGIDPLLFSKAGVLPHMTLSPYVRHCLPNYLKKLGYETHAVYTATWNFAGVGPGFKNYGIDNFIDAKAINAPTTWHWQRDKYFTDAARRILEKPSDKPRFIFVSTNSNHGPHGGQPPEIFAGPFDFKRTTNPAVADYVNRLNDTFNEMAALEKDMVRSGRRVAILFYGDHHPGFRKSYAESLPPDPFVKPDYLTLYRFAKTYGTKPASLGTLWIEELPERFLAFADLPVPPVMQAIRRWREECGNSDSQCPARIRSAIGAALVTQ